MSMEPAPEEVAVREAIEPEDTDSPRPRPWDPKAIRIYTKVFSIREIVDMIAAKDIDLAPDFQRRYVWSEKQQSLLIESVLLGIPLPAFYFHQEKDGVLQVVDGVQRLTTIYRYFKEHTVLEGLEYLKELQGLPFKLLEPVHKRRLQQTQLHVNVIEPQTPDDVKFDVFRRINTLGSPLTAQEIRHCMSREPSRSLLKELSSLEVFHQATDGVLRDDDRMTDREMALRFCAFRSRGIEDYRSHDGLDAFLLDFSREVDGLHPKRSPMPERKRASLQADFERAMQSAIEVFGNAAFRRYPPNTTRRGKLNRALFESWAVALASYEPGVLTPHRGEILGRARALFLDKSYDVAISQGTGDAAKVQRRFEAARRILTEVLA